MPKKDEPQYTHMKDIEIALAKRWRTEGKTPSEIALLLKRDVKMIRKQTDQKKPCAKVMKVGRRPMPETVDTVLQFCFWHSSDSGYQIQPCSKQCVPALARGLTQASRAL